MSLIGRHTAAVEENEATNAAGKIAALATRPLAALSNDGRRDLDRWLAPLANVDAEAKRFQSVLGIRLYAEDGRGLYPRGTAPARDDVRITLQNTTLWSRNLRAADGQDVRREFVPFVSARSVYVIAIDLSRPLMRAQTRDEAQTVRVATLGAIALLFVAVVILAGGASRELERLRRQSARTLVTTLTASPMRSIVAIGKPRDLRAASLRTRASSPSNSNSRTRVRDDRTRRAAPRSGKDRDSRCGPPQTVRPDVGGTTDHRRASDGSRRDHSRLRAMDDPVPCVLRHHERIDGTGYPDHLAAAAIPRGARVIAVADSFDAMTTDRPYRRAIALDVAVAELRRVAGTQLDEAFVGAFERLVARGLIVPPAPVPSDEAFGRLFATPASTPEVAAT